jgi:hypothetical protein
MSEQVVEHNTQWPNLIGDDEDESFALEHLQTKTAVSFTMT